MNQVPREFNRNGGGNQNAGNHNGAEFPFHLLTKCPYTFRAIRNPNSNVSPYVKDENGQPRQLPQGWAGSGTITIAMAGARSSGKSLYMAVVIKLLKRLVITKGHTFRPANAYTERTYREHYEEPLFENMGILPPTPPSAQKDAYQREPLIFDIGAYPRGPRGDLQKIFVVFRDVAGEDLKAEGFESRRESLSFFGFADQVIFLYDPMAVPRIRDLLAGTVSTHEVGADDPADVLRNLLSVLGSSQRPFIALTLSKFDTLQNLENISLPSFDGAPGRNINWQRVMGNKGARFSHEGSDLDGPFDLADHSLLNAEVKSLLECLEATELTNQMRIPLFGEKPYLYSCFAVSALGDSPASGKISRSGIAPFRCLDPIRHCLHYMRVFE
ncbi:TRAFAC clade GTPase domain-containing protein [Corynebacterium auriscanis]|uniref:TRAFAC clade GTPase domain-containing protein n=1 Tax=Corynebacterium auriscanis TaxID=99807 RepID=UPI003CED2F77